MLGRWRKAFWWSRSGKPLQEGICFFPVAVASFRTKQALCRVGCRVFRVLHLRASSSGSFRPRTPIGPEIFSSLDPQTPVTTTQTHASPYKVQVEPPFVPLRPARR